MTYQFNVEDKWYFFADEIRSVSGELNVINDISINGNLKAEDASFNNVDISGSLTLSNGSSADASDGDVLTISGDSMIWSAPPSPALTFYQFIATGSTSNFNINDGVADLDYSSMALDVSSSSSGNDISYIPNTGTFSFLTAGVYHISIFFQLQAVNYNALRFQARLLKNGTFLTSSSIYDSDSNINARDATITIIQNMAFGDTLTLAAYAYGSSTSLQWRGNNQTRMSVIKLS